MLQIELHIQCQNQALKKNVFVVLFFIPTVNSSEKQH
jgi:hypothetical protein